MLKYVFIGLVVVCIYYCISNHIHIKWKTFFKKGFIPNRNKFGVYCFCGKQGQGKTLAIVTFLNEHKNMKIYSNIKSIKGIDYIYYSGFDELLKLRDEHDCIIVFDEIFTALTKSTRITTDVLDFLSQMRKRNIIFLTSAQEWLEINITLRRYCRYQIDCNMRNFMGVGIITKKMYDAEKLKWSQNDNEYIAPLIETTIAKTNKKIADSYDTFEQINKS